jgi:addiction module RelE/StbE family toxin
MEVIFHKQFSKRFIKLSKPDQDKFEAVLEVFVTNPHDHSLRNHSLIGTMAGSRTINIKSDLRAVFVMINETTAFFTDIGTHAQLYK